MSTLQAGITLRPDYSRIISATGSTNIASVSVANRGTKYFSDICTTLIDIQWRWNLLLFFGGFTITWIGFACFYVLLAYVNGDMFEQEEGWLPCVENVHDFASSFLFSIETMTTIGYGSRYVTEACPGAYLGVIVQSVLGAALQFALAGLVVAKVKRAKKRCTTILFSKVACIYAEDLQLRLAIRIGDMRKSDIIGAHCRAYFIRTTVSKTGDKIPVQYFNMDFKSEGGNTQLFLPWPTFIIHNINEDSPLYGLSRDDTMTENYEMIVMLEAVSSSLSQSFQVRKSYHPWEIRWGHRFLSLGHTIEDMFDANMVDYENFHETKPVSTPMVSAHDIDEMSVKGEISPEKLQKRKDSRQEVNYYMSRRKSVTDTFLGAEEDISVSEMSMSDTTSIDRLRRMSATTYHGPGTMERRKTLGNIFGSAVSMPAIQRNRRHSTGTFLEQNALFRGRRMSAVLANLQSQASIGSRERIYTPRVLDIKSETHEESGPRYIKKKRVTLNPNIITEPSRKVSDPGLPSTPLVSVLNKRRRHSTWQFTDQDSFLKEYRRNHPEAYLRTHIEESEESGQESNHGSDVQDPSSLEGKGRDLDKRLHGLSCLEVNNNEKDDEKPSDFSDKTILNSNDGLDDSNNNRNDIKDSEMFGHLHTLDVVEEGDEASTNTEQTTDLKIDPGQTIMGRRRVVRGSLRRYVVDKVSDSDDNDDPEEKEVKCTEEQDTNDTIPTEQGPKVPCKDDAESDMGSGDEDKAEVNQAYMYDSEDDIGYSRHIVESDNEEDVDMDHAKVNLAYESDNNDHDK